MTIKVFKFQSVVWILIKKGQNVYTVAMRRSFRSLSTGKYDLV